MKRNIFIKLLIGLPLVVSQLSFKKASKLGKTIFTPEMLSKHNYGLFIINIRVGDVYSSKNIGYCATMSYKLGYQHDFEGSGRYNKISAFTDGFCYPLGRTHQQVCEWLNNNPYGEQYRLMTKEEVIFLISNRQQGFL